MILLKSCLLGNKRRSLSHSRTKFVSQLQIWQLEEHNIIQIFQLVGKSQNQKVKIRLKKKKLRNPTI
jgi:hypothetical protein